MAELWDIYDANRTRTGGVAERGVYIFKEGEYHIVVECIIINSKNEILISKRAAHKNNGLLWELNGGSILKGETSLQGIVREIREELGIEVKEEEAIFFKYTKREKNPPNFKEFWLFRKDVNLEDITFPDGESIEAKWVSIEEFNEMTKKGEIVPTTEFGVDDYNRAITMLEEKEA